MAHDLSSAVLFDGACAGIALARRPCAIQHHRAHIASVLAERGAWDKRVLGVSFEEQAMATTARSGAARFSPAASPKASNAWPTCGPRCFPAATRRRGVRCRRRPDFWLQVEGLPDLSAAPFRFPCAL